MAIDRMRTAWANDELREWIEFRDKARMDEKSRLEYARRAGLAEGREEGRLDGLREAARKMVEQGMSRDTVCRALDLAPTDLP